MKKYLIFLHLSLILIVFPTSYIKAQSVTKYFLFPTIEIQPLNKQSLGLGLTIGNGGFGITTDLNFDNNFNLRNKNANDYIYNNRISGTIGFPFLAFAGLDNFLFPICIGLNFSNYTNFRGYGLAVGPEIGIGHAGDYSPWPYLCYYSNFSCYRNNINPINRHNLMLRFWIKFKNGKGEILNQRTYSTY